MKLSIWRIFSCILSLIIRSTQYPFQQIHMPPPAVIDRLASARFSSIWSMPPKGSKRKDSGGGSGKAKVPKKGTIAPVVTLPPDTLAMPHMKLFEDWCPGKIFFQTNLWSSWLQILYGTIFEAHVLEWEVLWHLFERKASRQGLFHFQFRTISYVSCLHVTGYSGCILQLGWNQLPSREWIATGLYKIHDFTALWKTNTSRFCESIRSYIKNTDLGKVGPYLLRPVHLPHRNDYGLRGTSDVEQILVPPKKSSNIKWSHADLNQLIRLIHGHDWISEDIQHALGQLICLNGFQSNSDIPGTEKIVFTAMKQSWLSEPALDMSSVVLTDCPLGPQQLFMVKGWNRSVCCLAVLWACYDNNTMYEALDFFHQGFLSLSSPTTPHSLGLVRPCHRKCWSTLAWGMVWKLDLKFLFNPGHFPPSTELR